MDREKTAQDSFCFYLALHKCSGWCIYKTCHCLLLQPTNLLSQDLHLTLATKQSINKRQNVNEKEKNSIVKSMT